MAEILCREWVYLRYYFTVQLEQIFPYWAIGTVLGSALSVFGMRRIHGLFAALKEKKAGALGLIPAAVLGIASPLSCYGTVPLAASFGEKGTGDDLIAAFMLSSVLLNPQLIAYSAVLGPVLLTVRILSCFACGVLAGLLVRVFWVKKGRSFFKFTAFRERPSDRDTDPRIPVRFLKNMLRNLRATGPYFFFGIALSALFQRYVPPEAMTAVFGGNEAWGVLTAAAAGVPLYACGGGTVPLLQTWLWKGMSPGSAAAFMITGPATKITNLGAFKTILGLPYFLLYIAYAAVFATACGLLVNLIL